MSESPNINCLKDNRCPKCGSYGPFMVEVVGFAELTDDGYEDYLDMEEKDEARWSCAICNFEGMGEDFVNVPQRKARMPHIEFGEDTDYMALASVLWILNGRTADPDSPAFMYEFHLADGTVLVGEYVDVEDDRIKIRVGNAFDSESRVVASIHLDTVEKIVYL
jgi:hypothetical protein